MAKRKPFYERDYVDHLTYGMVTNDDDMTCEELEEIESIWVEAITSQIPPWVPRPPSNKYDGFYEQMKEMLPDCFNDKETARTYMRLARKENVKEQVREALEDMGKL